MLGPCYRRETCYIASQRQNQGAGWGARGAGRGCNSDFLEISKRVTTLTVGSLGTGLCNQSQLMFWGISLDVSKKIPVIQWEGYSTDLARWFCLSCQPCWLGTHAYGEGKKSEADGKRSDILAAVWKPPVKGITFLFWTYFQVQLQGMTPKMRAPSSLTALRRRLHTTATSK